MKDLIALKGVTYSSKWRKPGDRFEARDNDAVILVGIGKAAYAVSVAVTPKSQPAPQAIVEPVVVDDAADGDLDALRAEYAALYGKKPHHLMKEAGLIAAIAEKK